MKPFRISLVVLLFSSSSLLLAQAPNSYFNNSDQANSIMLDGPFLSANADFSVFSQSNHSIDKYFKSLTIKKSSKSSSPIESLSTEDLKSAGTIAFNLNSGINLNFLGRKVQDEDAGNLNLRGINLHGGVNFTDNWGARINLMSVGQTDKPEQGDEDLSSSETIAKIEVVRNFNLGSHPLNVYAGFGIGTEKYDQFSFPQIEEFKENITEYGVGVEMPLQFGGKAVYITPMVSYLSTKWKADEGDFETTYNRAIISAMPYSFFNCEMFELCGDSHSEGVYDQGAFCFGGGSNVSFEFGTLTNDNGSNESSSDKSEIDFNIDASYFVIDKLAVRLLAGLANQKINESSGDFTLSGVSYGLGVMAHPIPNLERFFVDAHYVGGSSKIEFGSNEDKDNLSQFGGGIGYDLHIAPGLALSPSLLYTSQTQKDDDSDYEEKYGGISVNIGTKIFIPQL